MRGVHMPGRGSHKRLASLLTSHQFKDRGIMNTESSIIPGSIGAIVGVALVAALIAGVCALCDR